jgi:nucleotide-binding universal stress UspA family protein
MRCPLVATDGSPAAQSALRYAMEFAAAVRADEIACLCVREPENQPELAFAPCIAAGEVAAGCTSPVITVSNVASSAVCQIDPDAVLDACGALVTTSGFRFTPITCRGPVSAVLPRLAELCDTVFLGRVGNNSTQANNLGSTVVSVLERSPQTVFVCPPAYQAIQRIAIAHSGRTRSDRLIRCASEWSTALHAAMLILVAGTSSGDISRRREVIRNALAHARLDVPCESHCGSPAEVAERLGQGDLLLVGRHSRCWPLRAWYGSNTETILRRAVGPVAVLPDDTVRGSEHRPQQASESNR